MKQQVSRQNNKAHTSHAYILAAHDQPPNQPMENATCVPRHWPTHQTSTETRSSLGSEQPKIFDTINVFASLLHFNYRLPYSSSLTVFFFMFISAPSSSISISKSLNIFSLLTVSITVAFDLKETQKSCLFCVS